MAADPRTKKRPSATAAKGSYRQDRGGKTSLFFAGKVGDCTERPRRKNLKALSFDSNMDGVGSFEASLFLTLLDRQFGRQAKKYSHCLLSSVFRGEELFLIFFPPINRLFA